jgi:two-component system chemotaxis sensor kinase CheA
MSDSSDQDAELLLEFRTEALEHLEVVEPALLTMDDCGEAEQRELVNAIFRAVHSVKGASGFFGLDRVQQLSHGMESLLMKVRDGEIPFDACMTEPLLAGLDRLQALVDAIPQAAELSIDAELAAVEAVSNEAPPVLTENAGACVGSNQASGRPLTSALEVSEEMLKGARRFGQRVFEIAVPSDRLNGTEQVTQLRQAVAEIGEELGFHQNEAGVSLLAKSVLARDLYVSELELQDEWVQEVDRTRPDSTEPKAPAPEDAPAQTRASSRAASPAVATTATSGRETGTIRVNVRLLDKLMNLAGELVLSRNQLLRGLEGGRDGASTAVLQDLDLITSELQGSIMNTRMQPIGMVFNKFSRIVRDLSKKLGKEVRLVLEGSDVELDRSIIELLSDPLTHLVRNALDHGAEAPAQREQTGKAREGTLWLRAFHEGGQVHIEIEDDGRGIDPQKTRALAVERGVLTREEAVALSDRDARMLIFRAGFSMAEEVTDVSGRGVGMDVVKSNIAKLGGKIDLESQVAVGTKLRIRLPLTLAIIPSLIVRVGSERFAVPQVNLVELVRAGDRDASNAISVIQGAEVLPLRGKLLPLVRLARVLDEIDEPQPAPPTDREAAPTVAVLQVGAVQFGLVVDAVLDSEEIVVKPLARLFDRCRIYAGATIMGDGRVAMILDAAGVAAEAGVRLEETQGESIREDAAEERSRQVVLFSNAEQEQFAIGLDQVVRLEKVRRSDIEQLAGREYIQYRGTGLPLIRLEQCLPVSPVPDDAEDLFVLVPRAGSPHGILVGQVIDTLEDTVCAVEEHSDIGAAVTGSSVIEGRLTLFLDAEQLAPVVPEVAA